MYNTNTRQQELLSERTPCFSRTFKCLFGQESTRGRRESTGRALRRSLGAGRGLTAEEAAGYSCLAGDVRLLIPARGSGFGLGLSLDTAER